MDYIRNRIFLALSLLIASSMQTTSAQTVDRYKIQYDKEKLIGKEWSISGKVKRSLKRNRKRAKVIKVSGKQIEMKEDAQLYTSFKFDTDSISLTIACDGDTAINRYAYYLSDKFDTDFNHSNVGKNIKGNIINMFGPTISRYPLLVHNAIRIWEIKDDEITLVILGSKKRIITLKAKPNDA